VAVAAGYAHSLALSSNGCVVAWGTNNYGQCTVPAAASNNVMAIAAGDNHSVALLNNGTIVAWGNNTNGQINIPQFNPTNTVVLKRIAAGGNHTMASIFSSLVQYPVDVSTDLLLIFNSNSIDSWNVCQYYRTNRPMVSAANVLGIVCPTNETISPTNYTNLFAAQVQSWLTNNPTKRPFYVILFQDLPSRVNTNIDYTNDYAPAEEWPSVQCQLNRWCAPGWEPFVTSLNMNGLLGTNYGTSDGTADCIAYIDRLTNMAGTNTTLFISPPTTTYSNTNWYFNDRDEQQSLGYQAKLGVLAANPSASITYTNGPNNLSLGTNVAGYFSWGFNGSMGGSYATNGTLLFYGESGWYAIETDESFNGRRFSFQGNLLEWFSPSAFGGTNYSNTPIGAVTQVDEPGSAVNNPYVYFNLWASGKIFAICAWNSFYNYGSPYPQMVGDPFTKQ
jgi:hypothetical protein